MYIVYKHFITCSKSSAVIELREENYKMLQVTANFLEIKILPSMKSLFARRNQIKNWAFPMILNVITELAAVFETWCKTVTQKDWVSRNQFLYKFILIQSVTIETTKVRSSLHRISVCYVFRTEMATQVFARARMNSQISH